MILFVFEGAEREPDIYKTIDRLYFPKRNGNIICSFGNNIYALYKTVQALGDGSDTVSIIREHLKERGDTTLDGLKSSDISEIFLFFDYDFQNRQLSIAEMNKRVGEMLAMFCDETEAGKLYINYPMIESIRYIKSLPDENYCSYIVTREECCSFKKMANNFSCYKSLDFILFKEGVKPTKEKFLATRDNWETLKGMNVVKSNFIITGQKALPVNKEDINQAALFEAQKTKFVERDETVAILNSFPIFIYEYLA